MTEPLKNYAIRNSAGEVQAWHWHPVVLAMMRAEIEQNEKRLLILRYKQAIDAIICLKNRLPEN